MKTKKAKIIMKKLQKDYNLVASSFASTRDRLWPEMKVLFDYAKKGERVLDVGCGNGRFSKYLSGTEYVGVDFSEKMIEEAEKRFPEKNFKVANILSLPFQDNYFDKVYGIAVIHQIPSYEYRLKALLEIKRVLKPGGYLFLTVWDIAQGRKVFFLQNALRNFFSSSLGRKDFILKRERYYYVFEKGELSTISRKAGFTPTKEGELKREKRRNFYLIARKS